MKTNWLGGLLLVLLAGVMCTAVAQTVDGRVHSISAEAPSQILPISAPDDELRGPLRLRDVLRQPYGDMQEPSSKPYRLSPEERHRLREQLRGPSDGGPVKGKS